MFTDLDWGFGFIAVALAAVGVPLILIADRLSKRIHSQIGQMLIVWPVALLGFVFVGALAILIVFNMFGPIAIAIYSLFKPN